MNKTVTFFGQAVMLEEDKINKICNKGSEWSYKMEDPVSLTYLYIWVLLSNKGE